MIVKLLSTLSLIVFSSASAHMHQVALRLEEHYMAMLMHPDNIARLVRTMADDDVYSQMLDELIEPEEMEESTDIDNVAPPLRTDGPPRVKYYIATNHPIHWQISQLGEVVARMRKASVNLEQGDSLNQEAWLNHLHLALGAGLYPIIVDLSSTLGPNQSNGFETSSWLGILTQTHARVLVSIAQIPQDWATLVSATEYVLAALLESAARGLADEEVPLELEEAPAVNLRVGGVTIPDEVVEEAIGVGWCCLTACLRRCSGRDAVVEQPPADPANVPHVPLASADPAPRASSSAVFTAYMIDESLQVLGDILMEVAEIEPLSVEHIPEILLPLRTKYAVKITKMIRAMITNSPPSFDINPTLTIQLHLFDLLANNPPAIDWFATKRELLQTINGLRLQFNAARQLL